MGLVKTRRLARRCFLLRAARYGGQAGGLKAGMKPRAKKEGALQPHLYKSGGQTASNLPRKLA